MAPDALRRSGRIRRPVKTYAAESEQADEEEAVAAVKQPKRKRKQVLEEDAEDSQPPSKRKRASDDDNDYSEASPAAPAEPPPLKPSKKSATRQIKVSENAKAAKTLRGKPLKQIYLTPEQLAAGYGAKSSYPPKSMLSTVAEERIERIRSKIPRLQPGQQETRRREYVDEPSEAYEKFLQRANTERMFILNRERDAEQDCHAGHADCPYESLKVAGSTGNVYTVSITHIPSCTCPVGIFQRKDSDAPLCKHTLYVLYHVLKAPEELRYQSAFLTSELRTLFANAPPLKTDTPEDHVADQQEPNNRKELSDDCPICFTEFEDDDLTVWCRAACGNNVHAKCFDTWARVKGDRVTCPFCRAPWQREDVPAIKKHKVNVANIDMPTQRSAGGYVNVRHLLDYSD